MLYKKITDLIGNTPLLEIDPAVHGLQNIRLYVKLEYYNPFGSVKDRIAWGMIKDDLDSIKNKTIIESSSGNTAKALQVLSSIHGISFSAFTNRIKVSEVRDVLKLLGATVEEFPGRSECPDPNAEGDSVVGAIDKLLTGQPDKYYHPSQYTNQKNIDTHFQTTGQEINNDVGRVDYFFGGLGTTGSTRGTAEFLREKNPNLQTVGIVSGPDDFIPGIRTSEELWEVGLFKKDFYQSIVSVSANQAIDSTLLLVRKCGVLAGPTSGAGFAGAVDYLRNIDKELTKPRTAVFIACDRIEWYISYFKERRPELFGKPAVTAVNITSQKNLEGVKIITAENLLATPNQNRIIIDIRGNMAYKISHIPSAINIVDTQLDQLLYNASPFPKNFSIVVVCPMGKRSQPYAALLQSYGYDAYSLEGGFTNWKEKNHPIENLV